MSPAPAQFDKESGSARPRIEGDREQEILSATLQVLSEVGYDRLTMDAVAQAAKASKATLYRRWQSKATLVIDALLAQKGVEHFEPADTGTLRGDLLAMFCGFGGITEQKPIALLAGVLTAIHRDEELGSQFRERFIGPKIAASRVIYDRARDRGELREQVDLDLLAPALAGIVLHRVYLMGEEPTPELVSAVVDQIILPAALHQPHEQES
ncbi:TetR/AcrR family transcriptional regulator [Nocardioides dubius]|uniref:TetR/AcrR family transcriptional regulator n=1 Tax=Nocardioides dubius TaxID=317019 RepID=A0ABP4ELM8_9ACTN